VDDFTLKAAGRRFSNGPTLYCINHPAAAGRRRWYMPRDPSLSSRWMLLCDACWDQARPHGTPPWAEDPPS
jgi:hypothetical protein